MTLAAFIRITRPLNSVVAGLSVILGIIMAESGYTGNNVSLLYTYPALIAAVAFITAGGNVINDYFDREIDAVNRPDRPIPSGAVTPRAALVFSGILSLFGLLACAFTNLLCAVLAIINSLLLVSYAMKLKGLPLAGNIVVSYLTASIFLFGGAIYGIHGLSATFYVALIVFLAILAREILKDAEDIEGDKAGGALTLPMQIGVRKTAAAAFILCAAAVVISLLPVFSWWGPDYIMMIIVADIVILAGAARALPSRDPNSLKKSKATTLLKGGMFLSLAIFIISALCFGII